MKQRSVFIFAVPIGLSCACLALLGTLMNAQVLVPNDILMHFITNALIYTLLFAAVIFIARKIFRRRT